MMKKYFKNKTILITGGTGSFGNIAVQKFLKIKGIKKIIIFSRDELKQHEMISRFNNKELKLLRFFIGDVRDLERLTNAFEGVDVVIHAAALKQVDTAEYNPYEFIKTNIMGAQNVIQASIHNKVKNIIALSTDKAAAPINLYGATKLCSDKMFIAANNIVGNKDIKFSVVRYGNVMGSRGSIIPLFLKQKNNKLFTITDKRMTRFNITLQESIDMVIWSLVNNLGGEIYVPKIPSYKIEDLARAICSKSKIKIIGIRQGEKLHEEMITKDDMSQVIDLGKYYAILPFGDKPNLNKYLSKKKAKVLNEGFSYNSRDNKSFLNVNEIQKILKREKFI